MTNNVVKYSESRMKCSFFTRSAKLRVNKLPLDAKRNEIDKLKFHIILLIQWAWNSRRKSTWEKKRTFQGPPLAANKSIPHTSRKIGKAKSNHLRLFFLQILKIALEIVVGGRLGLQISINLANLFGNDIGNISQWLFDWIFRHIPLETGNVRWKIRYNDTSREKNNEEKKTKHRGNRAQTQSTGINDTISFDWFYFCNNNYNTNNNNKTKIFNVHFESIFFLSFKCQQLAKLFSGILRNRIANVSGKRESNSKCLRNWEFVVVHQICTHL